MKLRTFALTMAVSLTTAISAQTATLVVNGGGELTGATDVAVLGSVYNWNLWTVHAFRYSTDATLFPILISSPRRTHEVHRKLF